MNRHRNLWLRGWVLLGVVALASFPGEIAKAYESSRPFIHPDSRDAHELAVRVKLPGKINLNRASLLELTTLPGVDESLALQLIRLRRGQPLRSVNDLFALPYVSPGAVRLLIEQIQRQVTF